VRNAGLRIARHVDDAAALEREVVRHEPMLRRRDDGFLS
jgi:hypothetical protein